jgi:hypothetical protein
VAPTVKTNWRRDSFDIINRKLQRRKNTNEVYKFD